jgi:hypothetical protein
MSDYRFDPIFSGSYICICLNLHSTICQTLHQLFFGSSIQQVWICISQCSFMLNTCKLSKIKYLFFIRNIRQAKFCALGKQHKSSDLAFKIFMWFTDAYIIPPLVERGYIKYKIISSSRSWDNCCESFHYSKHEKF